MQSFASIWTLFKQITLLSIQFEQKSYANQKISNRFYPTIFRFIMQVGVEPFWRFDVMCLVKRLFSYQVSMKIIVLGSILLCQVIDWDDDDDVFYFSMNFEIIEHVLSVPGVQYGATCNCRVFFVKFCNCPNGHLELGK